MDTKKDFKDYPKEITDIIGGRGKWQFMVIVVVYFLKILGAYHNFAATFMAPKIGHWCAQPEEGPLAALNASEWKNVTGKCERPAGSYVEMGLNDSDVQTEKCYQWNYDHSLFKSTVTEEFNLVCDKSWQTSLLSSIYMAGFLAACVVMGPLADRYGRRPVMLTSGTIFFLAAIINAFSVNYIMFAISRFVVAFGRTGALNASFILSMEIFRTSDRPIISALGGLSFVFGYISLPGVAFLTLDWFWFQVVITIPAGILCAMLMFVPESPRWLITKGHLKKAEQIIVKAAKINGKTIQNPTEKVKYLADIIKKNQDPGQKIKSRNFIDIVRKPNMRRKALIMFFLWFVVSFVFYGLSFNAGDIGGNLFANFAIFGFAQIPVRIVSLWTLRNLGRRFTLTGTMLLGGVSCIAILGLKPAMVWPRVVLATFGMSMISSAFNDAYLYSSELFPTEVRSLGVSSCSIFARFGSILAPFMKELGNGNNFMIPMGLFGSFAITAGVLVLLLPETMGSPLLETLEQGEEFTRAKQIAANKVTPETEIYTMSGRINPGLVT